MLASHGFTTHVVAFSKSPKPIPLDECVNTTVENDITVHRAQLWSPDWTESLKGDGTIMSESIVLTRYNREIFDLLNHLQGKYSYDLLHAFFLYPAGFNATAVAKYHGIKSIVSIRGNDIGKYLFDPLRREFVKSSLEQADYVTSVATSLLELADRTICPMTDKSRVILNSLDLARAKPDHKPQLELRGPVIGTAGLFRYKKGIIYLLKALAGLKEQYNFTFLLAGDYFNTEAEETLEPALDETGLRDRTILTGKIPHNEIFNYWQLFDIVVFPSLFAEGCPLSMLEAMAVKCPVIGSRSGAIPEIIEDGVSGLLIEPGSSEEIQTAVVKLLDNPDLRQRLGEGAYRRIEELNPTRELGEWMDVYKTVLGE